MAGLRNHLIVVVSGAAPRLPAWRQAKQPCGPRERHRTQEPSSAERSRVLDTHGTLPSRDARQGDSETAGSGRLCPGMNQCSTSLWIIRPFCPDHWCAIIA